MNTRPVPETQINLPESTPHNPNVGIKGCFLSVWPKTTHAAAHARRSARQCLGNDHQWCPMKHCMTRSHSGFWIPKKSIDLCYYASLQCWDSVWQVHSETGTCTLEPMSITAVSGHFIEQQDPRGLQPQGQRLLNLTTDDSSRSRVVWDDPTLQNWGHQTANQTEAKHNQQADQLALRANVGDTKKDLYLHLLLHPNSRLFIQIFDAWFNRTEKSTPTMFILI